MKIVYFSMEYVMRLKRFYDSTLYTFIADFLLKISTNLITQEVLRTLIVPILEKMYNRLG